MDYKRFPQVIQVEAFMTSLEKERETKDSGIHVFYNFKKIAFFKKKEEAKNFVRDLINKSPLEIQKEPLFEEYVFKVF